MSPIPHNTDSWRAFAAKCMRCRHHEVGGVCRLGIYHADHVNAGYCPAGVFGTKQRPASWPADQEGRFKVCRGCDKHAKGACSIDAATVRLHVIQSVCPLGKFVDGQVGRIELPSVPARGPDDRQSQIANRKSACCG